MNATILGLVIGHFVQKSPFLSLSLSRQPEFLSISNSRLTKFSNFFLFSRCIQQRALFSNSQFSSFLRRPITIEGTGEVYNDETYKRRKVVSGDKNVMFVQCTFQNCHEEKGHGGSLLTKQCSIVIDRCVFSKNTARYSGSADIGDAPTIVFNQSLITSSTAERFGAAHFDGHEISNTFYMNDCNITMNHAKRWIGGVRLQHNGGHLRFSSFIGNSAQVYGAIWDYGHSPAFREFSFLRIINNTASESGAGITGFHILYKASATNCTFAGNRNENGQRGRSIYLFADNSEFCVSHCTFDGPEEDELAGYHPDSVFSKTANEFLFESAHN